MAIRVLFGWSLNGFAVNIASATALFAGLLYSIVRTFSILPPVAALRSVFDKTNCCGGLLMAGSEIEIGAWSQAIPSLQFPRLHWDGRRSGLVFLSALLFLGFGFWVPQRYITPHSAGRLEIGDQTREIQEKIHILQEEAIVSEETAQAALEKIDQIKETALGREPVKTWEALGHLQDQIKKTAEEAAVGMLAETEALTQAETLAQALSQMEAELDPQAFDEALSQLSQMTQSLLAQNSALKKNMGSPLADSLQQAQLSPEQLRELLKALQGRKGELSQCMARLCSAELTELKLMQMCQKSGQCYADGLKAMLSGCQGGQSAKDAIALYLNNPNWGIDRGRGDAPMVWADPSSRDNTAFKEQLLPPASLSSLKDSQLVGVSVSAPSSEESDGSQLPGQLRSAEAGSGQAVKQTILPKHKAAVKEYFQRDSDTQ